jgi:hypothetical protein
MEADMIDIARVDETFEAAKTATGHPPRWGFCDRTKLVPLDSIPYFVYNETGCTLPEDRIDEIAASGWFRVEEHEGERGVPMAICLRIGLLLELEEKGYTRSELRDFAEFEDDMIDGVYTTDELEYRDDDVDLLIANTQNQFKVLKNSLRVLEEPSWQPDEGGWTIGPKKPELVSDLKRTRTFLDQLLMIRRKGMGPKTREEIERMAFRVRALDDVIRIGMLTGDHKQVRAGYSFFVVFKKYFKPINVHDEFEQGHEIDWARTVRRPWFAEGPDRVIRLPGMILEGDQAKLVGPTTPTRYTELFNEYDLGNYFAERARMLEQRVCIHCFAALPTDCNERKKYCGDECRNAAKQKRFRSARPLRALEHQRKYYSTLPEIKERGE